MADLVTRLILKNDNFNRNLKMSAQEIKQFRDIGNKVTGTIGKFAGALGIATTASQIFNRYINATQTLSDEMNNSIGAASMTVDAFFVALNRGNFSAFLNGLSAIYNKMKDIQELKDSLGDAKLSEKYNYSKFSSDFEEIMAVIQNPDATPKELKNAITKGEKLIKDYSKSNQATQKGTIKTLLAELEAFYPNAGKWSENDLRQYLSIYNNDFLDNENTKNFKEYKKKRNSLKYKAEHPEYITDKMTGDIIGEKDNTANEKAWANFQKQHGHSFFERMYLLNTDNDERRENMLNELTYVDDLARRIESSKKRLYRGKNRVNAKNDLTPKTTPKPTTTETNEDPYKDIAADMSTVAGTSKMITELTEKQKTANIDDLEVIGKKIQFLRSYLGLLQSGNIDKESQEILVEQFKNGDFEDEFEEVKEEKIEPKINPNSLEGLKEQKDELIKKLNETTSHDEYVQIQTQIATVDDKMTDISVGKGAKQKDLKLGKNAKLMNNLAKSIRGVGSAMQATGNQSKAMARSMAMVSAAASIAMMISIMVEKSKTSVTIWDWIAGITAGVATCVAMAQQLRSINTAKYAEGGVVASNSTIGDQNLVRVNGGEMILNNRQQRNLFNLLNNNGTYGSNASNSVEFHIEGRQLVGVLENYNNKMNKVR